MEASNFSVMKPTKQYQRKRKNASIEVKEENAMNELVVKCEVADEIFVKSISLKH